MRLGVGDTVMTKKGCQKMRRENFCHLERGGLIQASAGTVEQIILFSHVGT